MSKHIWEMTRNKNIRKHVCTRCGVILELVFSDASPDRYVKDDCDLVLCKQVILA